VAPGTAVAVGANTAAVARQAVIARQAAETGTILGQSAVAAGPVVGPGGVGRAGRASSFDAADLYQVTRDQAAAATQVHKVAAGTALAGTALAGTALAGAAQLADITGAGTLAGSAAFVPALPMPPPRTSCRAVVHIGDSTSEGLTSPSYLPNPSQRITAQYAKVGVSRSIMDIVGGTSVVETLPGTLNAFDMASQQVHGGYHGCWVIALGTNDTADVYVGSTVGRVQRVEKMMKLIGGQPVLWVAVKSLVSGGPYSELDMRLWNQALAQVAPRYPNMRIYNWPAVVQRSWFISDGIHFTSAGYAARGRLIADALAAAFPAS
jgi:hypothetical protein